MTLAATAHEALVAALRRRLAEAPDRPLPGYAAHAEMAPFPSRTDPAVISVEGKTGRTAATLVLLYPGAAGEPTLVLTQRQPSLRAHSGQISLPGGAIEPGETPEETARREAHEEIGVAVGIRDVLGRLTPIYVPPSHFRVWPVVAALAVRPDFQRQESEVAAVIEAPVSVFTDPASRRRRLRPLAGTPAEVAGAAVFDVPFFAVGDGSAGGSAGGTAGGSAEHEVWGATAMMLAEFAAVVHGVSGG